MYIGRPSGLSGKIFREHPGVLDGTALGNPYTVSSFENPADCLRAYKRWLWDRVKPRANQNPKMLVALESIGEETVLVCSCKPKPCHGDILMDLWRYMQTDEWRGT